MSTLRALLPPAAAVLATVLLSAAPKAQTIVVDTQSIPADGSRRQQMTLFTPAPTPQSVYLVVGSVTGTSPGIPLDGGLILPLNPDFYLDFTASNQNSAILPTGFGSMQSGVASTDFVIPSLASLAGLRFDHAFVVIDSFAFTGVSDAVPIHISAQPLDIDGLRSGDAVLGPVADLSGDVGDLIAGTQGAIVTVNGRLATIDPSGLRWDVLGLNLGIGPRTLTVRAQNAAGQFEQFAIDVQSVQLEANNVVTDGRGRAFAALGTDGFAEVDLATRQVRMYPPPATTSQVDDLSVSDGYLHLLDGSFPGRQLVVDVDDPAVTVSGPITVPVGPYAGISAAGGTVVVSGGSSMLTVREVDASGQLGTVTSSIDLGAGQFDVLTTDGGARAIASVDFNGTVAGQGFGVASVAIPSVPNAPSLQYEVGLAGAGFTTGTLAPANFPIVAAELSGPEFAVAHGGGLSFIDDVTGNVNLTLPLGALAHVTVAGDRLFAVGGSRLVEVDVSGVVPSLVSNQFLAGANLDLTGVAADAEHVVIAANGGGLLVLRR